MTTAKAKAKAKSKSKAKAVPKQRSRKKQIEEESNAFDLPPPPGQETLGRFFHVPPPHPRPGTGAGATGDENSSSSSSSSGSPSQKEDVPELIFEDAADDLLPSQHSSSVAPGSPDETVSGQTFINLDGAIDSMDLVKSFDSMFRFAERHVARVERVLSYQTQPSFWCDAWTADDALTNIH